MNTIDGDPIAGALGQLVVDAPTGLVDRLVARWVTVPGPVGEIRVAFTDLGICYVRATGTADEFARSYRSRFDRPILPADRPPAGLLTALRTGRSRTLRFDLRGLSAFEREVLVATLRIPRGQTRPYAWVAGEIGRPRAVRAVGTALGRNPVPVLIPCHRVTRSDGDPGQYVFGAELKEALLRAEDVDLDGIRALAAQGMHYLGSDTTGIVCFPTCHHARRITAAHRRPFRNVSQASQAGYRPCRDCRPGQPVPA
ncbi:MAG TPA: methylated-DNA--[protein]-cysteine S-methyltransferase [Pseudonocardiaceae bacterium]|nr:methylated-DNA--[protein]-cysteine S-methyltransferase [Pseudonocardiaceae bacterium]